jgi:DNA helicase-2/ATP-dependent DNA helicase PcrA
MKTLTDEQEKVIDFSGNMVITARPGSGKTFTLVEKISRILPELPCYKGVAAISFTNKASDELKKRCKQKDVDAKSSFFGTIDKFCLSQIIIPFADHITGFKGEYCIVDNNVDFSKYSELCNSKKEWNNGLEKAMIEALKKV